MLGQRMVPYFFPPMRLSLFLLLSFAPHALSPSVLRCLLVAGTTPCPGASGLALLHWRWPSSPAHALLQRAPTRGSLAPSLLHRHGRLPPGRARRFTTADLGTASLTWAWACLPVTAGTFARATSAPTRRNERMTCGTYMPFSTGISLSSLF